MVQIKLRKGKNNNENKCNKYRGGGYYRYEIIDFLKGFSILTIVMMHLLRLYMVNIPDMIKFMSLLGGTGVHVFIFCSGFGLYMSQLKHKKSFMEFLKKRFFKIYIPYILVRLTSAVFPFMYTVGVHFWFISTIIQFYILFIPLCRLKEKLGKKKFMITCMVISVSWWLLVTFTGKGNNSTWFYFCLQFLWEFAIGMLVAGHLHEGKDIYVKTHILLMIAIIGIALEGIMGAVGGNLKLLNDIPAFLGYICLALFIYSLFNGKRTAKQASNIGKTLNGMILKISSFSYEWYLVHILIFEIIFHILPSGSLGMDCIVGLIALAASIFAAYGYSWVILRVRTARTSRANFVRKK